MYNRNNYHKNYQGDKLMETVPIAHQKAYSYVVIKLSRVCGFFGKTTLLQKSYSLYLISRL